MSWWRSSIPRPAPACAIIKHANPCGVALGKTLKDAYLAALACDTLSAFGGVLAFNQTLDGATAEEISKIFTEVIIAPDADEDARSILAAKKNLRLLTAGGLPDPLAPTLTYRSVAGGFLVQTRDNGRVTARRAEGRHQAPADRAGNHRHAARLHHRQACEVQRHHLCEGRLRPPASAPAR